MRYRLCAALLTLLLAPPALDAAHAAEPAPTAATANEDAAVVSAPAPLDLGSLLTIDVYVLQAPSPLRVDVACRPCRTRRCGHRGFGRRCVAIRLSSALRRS